MPETASVLEYKCPCCGAALAFRQEAQKLSCDSCGNAFDIEAVREFNEGAPEGQTSEFTWEEATSSAWSESEQAQLRTFLCPSCGGEILSDENTVATFCPFCDSPAILPGRLSGGLKPDGVIPFRTGKEDAQKAFLALCKGKPLLPRDFTAQQRLEKITAMYVPFWLYDCDGKTDARYQATRIRHWSDAKYDYTRTDHFLLIRGANASFSGIPMDGSSKLDNGIMESIEPFDYAQLMDFDTAYLAGYLADKYDVEAKLGEERIRQRVSTTMDEMLLPTLSGYTSAIPTSKNLDIRHSKARYVLLPVWLLNSRYRDKTYVFAMNGQTGKMTGTLPVSPKRSAAWFAGICAGVALLVTLAQYLLM